MNLQNKNLVYLKRLLNHKSNMKFFLFFNFIFCILIFQSTKAETNNFEISEGNEITIKYLDSKNELEDYILDTGDSVFIKFFPASELDGFFPIDEEGELFLPRVEKTYVRGLTTSELRTLLEEKYTEYLIQPKITVRIVEFKPSRVLISGEVRNPGIYKFPAYTSGSFIDLDDSNAVRRFDNSNSSQFGPSFGGKENLNNNENIQSNSQTSSNYIIKRSNENITTISDVIRKSGGITSQSDLSRIRIIRDIPIGKGGGKKSALLNFNSYLEQNPTNDIRIFDGDSLFIPKLTKANPSQIPTSILTGLSPRFISVNLFGRVETPGTLKLPLEATLSDALDLSGPIKPLSGKVVLIRYKIDGTILKENISYSAGAKRGSKKNPYLKENDLISVKNSILGKATSVIGEFTAPFVGIYSTLEIFEGLAD